MAIKFKINESLKGAAAFDQSLGHYFGRDYRDNVPGDPVLGKFDHIFIDGKSVSQLCKADTWGMDTETKDEYMKTFTAEAVAGRDKRIDIVDMTKPGKREVVPVHSEVKEPKPKLGFFMNILNKIGIYKTEPEKREAAYQKKLAEVAKNPAADEKRQKGMLEASKMSEFTYRNERESLGVIDAAFTKEQKERYSVNRSAHMRTQRHSERLIVAKMFADGHSFGDIMDPDKLQAEKREAGQAIAEMIERQDPRETAKLYQDFAEKYNALPPLQIDYTNTSDILRERREIHCRSSIAFDIAQEYNMPHEEEYQKACEEVAGPGRHKKLLDTLCNKPAYIDAIRGSMHPPDDMNEAAKTMGYIQRRAEVADVITRDEMFKNEASIDGDIAKTEAFLVDVSMVGQGINMAGEKLPQKQQEEIIQAAGQGRNLASGDFMNITFDMNAPQPEPVGMAGAEKSAAAPERQAMDFSDFEVGPAVKDKGRVQEQEMSREFGIGK